MLINETQLAALLGALTVSFLGGFWLFPGGVLALRRRARGELQVDLRPGYRPATLYRMLHLYGPDGTHFFRRMLLADMIFPAVYGALFYVLGDLCTSTRPFIARAAEATQIIGVAAAAFDYAENIFLLMVLRHLPREYLTAARLAGLCTSLKTLSMAAALSALAIALIA